MCVTVCVCIPDTVDVLDGVTDLLTQLFLIKLHLVIINRQRNAYFICFALREQQYDEITLTSSKGKRSWKMRLILAPPDSSTVST